MEQGVPRETKNTVMKTWYYIFRDDTVPTVVKKTPSFEKALEYVGANEGTYIVNVISGSWKK